MLFTYQVLFIGTTAWDFFMTVVVSNSLRSLIFSELPSGMSVFIIAPWLLGLFILTATILAFIFKNEFGPPITPINFEYGGIMIVYIILFILSLFNPAVSWPLVVNYLINIVWAGTLICFRLALQRGRNIW